MRVGVLDNHDNLMVVVGVGWGVRGRKGEDAKNNMVFRRSGWYTLLFQGHSPEGATV